MNVLPVVARGAALQVREFVQRPLALTVTVVQPAAFCLLTVLVDDNASPAVLASRVTGTALIAVWANAVWAAGMILSQDRLEGTLTVVLTARQPLAILVGRSLGAAFAGYIGISATLLAALGLLGRLSTHAALALAWILLPALVSSTATGVLVAGLFISTRSAPRIAEALLYPVFVASGALLPLTLLPHWVRDLVPCLPLYWIRLLHDQIDSGGPVIGAIAGIIVVSGVYGLCGALVFRRATARARVRGDLDFS